MTNAPITPGIQPARVKRKTISMDPHPLSNTAIGGKIIDKITLQILIITYLYPTNFVIFYELWL